MLRRAEQAGDLATVWGAEAGARVPADGGRVAAIVAVCHVVETGAAVEIRVDESDRRSLGGIDPRDQAGPQRSHRAGAADHGIDAVDAHEIAGLRIGFAGHVGDAAVSQCGLLALAVGDLQPALPRRKREEAAYAAAAGASGGAVVPY